MKTPDPAVGTISQRDPRRTLRSEQWPLCLEPSGSTALLFRLQDRRFQIVRDGSLPVLLVGPDHILVRAPLRDALLELGATGWSSMPVVLYDPTTHEQTRVYDELQIDEDIRPSTVESVARARPNGVWHHERRAFFVARAIGDRLIARFPELHASVGFEEFG